MNAALNLQVPYATKLAKRRREDNIIMDLKEIGINTWKWVDSVQDKDYWRALVNAALNLQAPYATKLVSWCEMSLPTI